MDDRGAAQLEAGRARLADVLVLRVERDRIERSEADQIVEVIGEIGQLDRGAIAREPLLEADIEAARPFRLEIRIAEEAG